MTHSNTPSVQDLTALLARVEAAEGPDREIDALLEVLAQEKSERPDATSVSANDDGSVTTYSHGQKAGRYASHDFTASLDAALALCSRVLPGWELELTSEHRDDAVIWRVMLGDPLRGMDGESSTPALALLAAMLKALIAQASTEGPT